MDISSILRQNKSETYVEIVGHLNPSDLPEMAAESILHYLHTNNEESYRRNLETLDE